MKSHHDQDQNTGRSLRAGLVAGGVAATLLTLQGAGLAAPQTARQADEFVESIGVVTHLNYTEYFDVKGQIKPRMLDLGVRHYRDALIMRDPAWEARVAAMGAAGLKATLFWQGDFNDQKLNGIANYMDATRRLAPYLAAVEGPNESDLEFMGFKWRGQGYPEGTRQFMSEMYPAVKGDPTTAKLDVIGPSMGWGQAADKLGDLSKFCDYGGMHPYHYQGQKLTNHLDSYFIPHYNNAYPGKRYIVSETGYITKTSVRDGGTWGITEAAQGRYVIRTFTEAWLRDIKRVHMYQLLDQPPHDSYSHAGLVRLDGTLKPAYTAIKNTIALLQDRGAAFTPGSLDYTLSGADASVHSFLLQKRDGRFYVVLWQEVDSYDAPANRDILVKPQQVTLTLAKPARRAATFVPLESAHATTLGRNVSTLALLVPDHPVMVEIAP